MIAVVTDLIFSTKITGTAKALGKTVSIARTLARLEELLGEDEAGALVIVDLNAAGLNSLEAVRLAKATGARVVAFLSHVEVELAKQARDAGADEVMARSAFVTKLPTLLA